MWFAHFFFLNVTVVFHQSFAIMGNYVIMVIYHYAQGLTHYNGSPHNQVTPTRSEFDFHESGYEREWYLCHHTHKRPYFKCFQWYTYLNQKYVKTF